MRSLFAVIALIACGCGTQVAQLPERVNISGNLNMQGKPVSGVMLNFQPTGDGMPAVIAVDKGAFSGDVIPGKYTYFLSAGKDANAFKKVPEKYQAGATDRQIDITAGTPLNLEMN